MIALTFLDPARLVLLIVPLALAVAYVLLQRQRRGYAVRFTNLDLLDVVAPEQPRWRRHLPAIGVALGLIAGVTAFARPAVADEVANEEGVVVLAIDTSLSMEATDVDPSRIDAAKGAASAFLEEVPKGVKVGVVAFDGTARQVLAPTDRMDAVQRTIDRLELGEGTAIGEAVFTSLDTIASHFDDQRDDASGPAAGGDEPPGVIVLLSDGETTAGRPDDEAASAARDAGIAVDTIAFGTDGGTVTAPDGTSVSVPVNRAALADLARTTGGQALEARSAEQLRQVYERLGAAVSTEPITRDVTEWFVLLALVLVTLAAIGSLVWFSRLP